MIMGNSCTLDLGLFHQLSDSHLSDHSINVWGFFFSCILIDGVGSYKYVLLCECPDGVGQGTGDLVWLICRDDRLGFVDSYSSIFVRSSQITVQFVCKVSPYLSFSLVPCVSVLFFAYPCKYHNIICITDPRISSYIASKARVCRRARVRALYIYAFYICNKRAFIVMKPDYISLSWGLALVHYIS